MQKISWGGLRRAIPAIKNVNTYKVYSNMINQTNPLQIENPTSSLSILQNLLNHDKLKISDEIKENQQNKTNSQNSKQKQDESKDKWNDQNQEHNLSEPPYTNIETKMDEDPTIIWSGGVKVSQRSEGFDIEFHCKDINEVENMKKELIPTIKLQNQYVWPAGQALSVEIMKYADEMQDHELIIGWAQYKHEIDKNYNSLL